MKEARVMIQRIQRGRVVLAVDAPRDVPVVKGELTSRILRR
jgi:sRNA-binding carbon storage regulator CsrA